MNSLLHSKRFKKNLYKWLMMYFGALCMLTIVVTYSKYISTYTSDPDTAKVAKFDIELKYVCKEVDGTETISPTPCATQSTRPEQYLEYEFYIDASKNEVDTEVIAVVTIDSNFKIASNKGTGMYDFKQIDNTTTLNTSLKDNQIQLSGVMNCNSSGRFKVKLEYINYGSLDKEKYDVYGIPYYQKERTLNNILSLSYTAEQVDTKSNQNKN